MNHTTKSIAIAAVLIVMGTGGWILFRTNREDAGSGYSISPILVEARGIGRKWQFSYSGPDGRLASDDDIVVWDELKVPIDTEVVVRLRSDDYIYVFSSPSLDLREMAVPDLEFTIRFQVSEPGEHELAMDPMCGFRLPPGSAMGKITVTSAAAFGSWLESQP